jgi:hypothetical protein
MEGAQVVDETEVGLVDLVVGVILEEEGRWATSVMVVLAVAAVWSGATVALGS